MKNDWAVTVLAILTLCVIAERLPSAQAARPEFPREVRHHPGLTHDQLPKKFDGKSRISHHYEGVDEHGFRTVLTYAGTPKDGIHNLDREDAVQALKCTHRGLILTVTDDDAGDEFLNSIIPKQTILIGGPEWDCKGSDGESWPFYYLVSREAKQMSEIDTFFVRAELIPFQDLWHARDLQYHIESELVKLVNGKAMLLPRSSSYTLIDGVSWNLDTSGRIIETEIGLLSSELLSLSCLNCYATWTGVVLTIDADTGSNDYISAEMYSQYNIGGSLLGNIPAGTRIRLQDVHTFRWFGASFRFLGITFSAGFTPYITSYYNSTVLPSPGNGFSVLVPDIRFSGGMTYSCTWDYTDDDASCDKAVQLNKPTYGSLKFPNTYQFMQLSAGVGLKGTLDIGASLRGHFRTSAELSFYAIPTVTLTSTPNPSLTYLPFTLSFPMFIRIDTAFTAFGENVYDKIYYQKLLDISIPSIPLNLTLPTVSALSVLVMVSNRQFKTVQINTLKTNISSIVHPSEITFEISCVPASGSNYSIPSSAISITPGGSYYSEISWAVTLNPWPRTSETVLFNSTTICAVSVIDHHWLRGTYPAYLRIASTAHLDISLVHPRDGTWYRNTTTGAEALMDIRWTYSGHDPDSFVYIDLTQSGKSRFSKISRLRNLGATINMASMGIGQYYLELNINHVGVIGRDISGAIFVK